jgi:hypothetical protein
MGTATAESDDSNCHSYGRAPAFLLFRESMKEMVIDLEREE